jgi:4-phospho-D-threonate 3-dehydrogenase / 4-phospho-D-erythronate 3-dehydrogenase
MSQPTNRPILAITMGDAAGIGPEIAVRALREPAVFETCRPILIGDGSVIGATLQAMKVDLPLHAITNVSEARFESGTVDMLDLHNIDMARLKKAQVDPMAGRAAYEYIVRGIDLAMEGKIQGIVTCPIHKDALNQAGFHYPGHTEILADRSGTHDFAMMLVTGNLRVVLVTIHVSLRDAIEQVNEERILRAISLAQQAGLLLGIDHPRIAVPGLNPHAGENGMFGDEESRIITPAIRKAKEMGYDVYGPLPADTIFYRAVNGQFDFVTPMYHDQGLIPIKLLGFGKGVNITLGLPFIRTSVDHGTAFGKAWQFRADAGSLIEAIQLGAQMARTVMKRKAEGKG